MALSDYSEPLSSALLAEIQRAFDHSYQLAVDALHYADAKPSLSLELKSGRMAGRASPHKNLIELNKVIFRNNFQSDQVEGSVETSKDFVYDTIAHEMAHIVATRMYRSRGHDRAWKQVATVLGAVPRASGHFDTAGAEIRKPARRRTYPFSCQCQAFDFGSQRLANFLKGSRYQCRACKGEIKPDLSQVEAFEKLTPVRMAKLKKRGRP